MESCKHCLAVENQNPKKTKTNSNLRRLARAAPPTKTIHSSFSLNESVKSEIQRNHQRLRLIPLTKEILRTMMDFNAVHSHSATSLSEKNFYNTFSITSLVREEVHNILQELSIPDQFIRKQEIDELIERCLKEKVPIIQEGESKTDTALLSDSNTDQEIEVTVEMLNESDKNKLIVENFQILEQRITSLEERISAMVQSIPKMRYLQSRKFKLNTAAIRDELKHLLDKIETDTSREDLNVGPKQTMRDTCNSNHSQAAIIDTKNLQPPHVDGYYDDLFYEQRETALNMLNYTKSNDTLKLNERPVFNPCIIPVKVDMGRLNSVAEEEPPKPRKAIFMSNNEVDVEERTAA